MSGSVFSNVLGMKRTLLLCCQFMLACTGAATEDARDDGSSDDGDAQNGGGEGGASDGEGGTGGRGEDDTQVSLGGTSWRRLTSDQLNNTLVDLFGPGMEAGAPDPDIREHHFLSVGAAHTVTSASGVEKLQTLAYTLAEKVTNTAERRKLWFPCDVSASFKPCVTSSLQQLGRAMFRRPLTDATLTGLVALAEKGRTELGDPWAGVQHALAAMFQSPRFYYIQDKARASGDEGEIVPLDGFSVASRLSFLLWNSTPDAELLDAAASGALDAPAGIEKQAQRLWQSPRAKVGMREFFASAWGIHKAANRSFDVNLYPMLAATVGASAYEAAMRSIEAHILPGDKPLAEALLTNDTFVNRDIAPIYGLPALPGPAFAKTALPASAKRHGFFTHAAFLIANSTPDDTQPMLRGKTIRENLLCQGVPDPPPGLMATLPPLQQGNKATKRARLQVHREDPFCAGCHDSIDPPGLALENYDAAGFHRESEMGLAIDASGELDGVAFDGPLGFVRAVVAHPDFATCFVKNLYRHATAHVESAEEEDQLKGLAPALDVEGGGMKQLIASLTKSPLFTHVALPRL